MIGSRICIACGNNHLRLAYSNVEDYEYGTYHGVNYFRCTNCGLLAQYPLPPLKYIASFYPSNYRNHLQFGKRSVYSLLKKYQVNRVARELEHLAKHKHDNILEIGCGNGLLLTSLRDRGFHALWGTDMSDAGQKSLSQKDIVFRKADIEKTFPFNRRFEMIILNHVVEHLLDPILVLASCKKHLAETGKIVIITPNSDSILLQIFNKYWDGINAPRHIHIFSPRSLENMRKKLNVGRLTTYPVADPMQWALSVQNVFQNIPFLHARLKWGLSWYTIFLGIVFTPISLFTLYGKKSASMMYVLE